MEHLAKVKTLLRHANSRVSANLLAACLTLLLAVNTAHAAADKRIALVIGNSNYIHSPLKNPVNDAKDVASKLRGLGFEVIERTNLQTRQIGGTLREFRSKLTPGAIALVFYAGHGLQIKGDNYLPAVDADINSEEDVPNQSLAMKQIMDVLDESKSRLNLVFLDACRNNPYARSFRSADRGLARVSVPSGTLISYATRPGSVAADGDGRNGLYTSKLLAQMDSQLQIEQALKRVLTEVKTASQGKQEPWMEGSIEGDFCFRGCKDNAGTGTQVASLIPVPTSMPEPTRVQTEKREDEQSQRTTGRPQISIGVSELTWRTLEASEAYRNAPKSRSVKVRYKANVQLEHKNWKSSSLNEFTIKKTPIGEKCVTQQVATLVNGQPFDANSHGYFCGGVILGYKTGSITDQFITSLDELKGSLFPMRIGAKISMRYQLAFAVERNLDSTRASSCEVVSRGSASELHPQLTGAAWKIHCQNSENNQTRTIKHDYDDYYLEDLGVQLSEIGILNMAEEKYVLPSTGSQAVMLNEGARVTYTYLSYDWSVDD